MVYSCRKYTDVVLKLSDGSLVKLPFIITIIDTEILVSQMYYCLPLFETDVIFNKRSGSVGNKVRTNCEFIVQLGLLVWGRSNVLLGVLFISRCLSL